MKTVQVTLSVEHAKLLADVLEASEENNMDGGGPEDELHAIRAGIVAIVNALEEAKAFP
jgi:hypothetical protein